MTATEAILLVFLASPAVLALAMMALIGYINRKHW